jgi:hypothetical protein
MSSLFAATGRFPCPLRALALVVLLLCAAPAMRSQCTAAERNLYTPPKPVAEKAANEEPLLPEAGFLSNTSYTSQFFGFSFDLPLSVQGHQILLPLMPEREHSLLALQYEKDTHTGYITVTAIDPHPGMEVDTPEQREEQMRAWARSGGPSGSTGQFVLPDYMLHTGHFYYAIRHKGPNYAAQYWTNINNYAIKVVIGTNDKDFLRKAKLLMAQVRFYCTQPDGVLTTKDGKVVKPEGAPYEGPTIPTFRVNAAIQEQPARTIPLGTVSDGAYRNPDLGLQYDLPKGWQPITTESINDPPLGDSAIRESAFLHACSQTLLRISPQAGDDLASAAPKPMIVLRALDPNCLSMRTVTRLDDKRTNDEVAANLEALAEFGQISTDELASVSGHLFMVFHGTIAGPTTPSGDLSSRMSQSIFVTRYNKLLLVWSLIAPTTADLNAIPTSGVTFAGSPPIALRASLNVKK